MKQLIQNFKTGDLYVDEIPMPALSKAMVLVENKFSLISAGTERGTVSVAQSSMIGKAKKRPDLVKQVMDNVKKEGLKATIEKVKTKLDSPKALGYSTAGVVMASMDTGGKFKPGDRIACAGQDFASHAEVVSIPQNLCAKIPDNVSFEEASFTTLGAIALQGVRQAEPTLGEKVCVIGLGLLGQITCQLLKANGCDVLGIDVSQKMVDFTNESIYAKAFNRSDSNLISACENFTNGHGFDKVIITAAAPTNDPIELSAEILRKKGVVVMVGAVKMDVPRDPHFYRKELELKMSCSYGPGRYDVSYEEAGNDYPIGYVRWTEQRNMEAFLSLISSGAIDMKPLITHTYDIAEAEQAYELVLGKNEDFFIGILIKYAENELKKKQTLNVSHNNPTDVNIGFIGAGSFAQSYLIPNAKSNASLDTVCTTKGITAKSVADKFGFNNTSTSPDELLAKKDINTVFIATRHDTHAQFTIDSLKAGKHVFVEKPLVLTEEELKEVTSLYTEKLEKGNAPLLMVGYNRRFADVCVQAKREFTGIGEPLVMNFRVNAGFIPKDHWTQTDAGGGRILGEVCHFIDLMQYFTDAKPVKVYADCIDTPSDKIKSDDNLNVSVKFDDGSVGNLVYVANGDKGLPKERFEIFGGQVAFVIDDFKSGTLYKSGKTKKINNSGKGHKQEVEAFINAVKSGKESPISFESLFYTALVTLKINDSLSTGVPQIII